MNFAFCLFKYFPFGGLQKDFLKIAKECLTRGHRVDVYTMEWNAPQEPLLSVHLVPVQGRQNHTRCLQFSDQVNKLIANKNYDAVVGFNKISGLDVYYAADTCYQHKAKTQSSVLYRLLPRYRTFKKLEASIFLRNQPTQVLLISDEQQPLFKRYYNTENERFHLLPPGISKLAITQLDGELIRKKLRKEWGINDEARLILMVGSGFKTKGLDRSIYALASLPFHLRKQTQLFVIGQDHKTRFLKLAKKLNVDHQVQFLGGRHDVPHFLFAADVLVHPAYNENTGTILLEALVAGLPVLTTDVCGYAHYIEKARGGVVLQSPFKQEELNQHLHTLLIQDNTQLKRNAIEFSKLADIESMAKKAVDIIERINRL